MTDEQTADGFELELADGEHFAIVARSVIESDLSDGAFRLYALMVDRANASGTGNRRSRASLAALLGVSADTVDRRVRELEKAKLLERKGRADDSGRQTSNLWIIKVRTQKRGRDSRESAALGGRESAAQGIDPMRNTTAERRNAADQGRNRYPDPEPTRLGRGVNAPSLWRIDENGDAHWIGGGDAPSVPDNPYRGQYRRPARSSTPDPGSVTASAPADAPDPGPLEQLIPAQCAICGKDTDSGSLCPRCQADTAREYDDSRH